MKKKTKTPSAAEFQKEINDLRSQLREYGRVNDKLNERRVELEHGFHFLKAELHRRRTWKERLRDRLRKWLGVPEEKTPQSYSPYLCPISKLKPAWSYYVSSDCHLGDFMR